MSFLTPLGFLGALLAGPVILMYMLRLRRRDVVVSSTFLWQQVLQDNEANTPWQRLRRNWLLLLQLLILALLVLALARPFITVPAVASGQTVLLLDASASMTATEDNGQMRFGLAQEAALDIIDTMSNTDTLTVIAVGDVPQVLISQSQDRAQLREAVQRARPAVSRADWNAALTLAAGTASGEAFRVVMIGDGGIGRTAGLPGINGEVRYVPIGASRENVAITALATESLPGQPPQLFTQITNYGTQDADIIFDLSVDDTLLVAERYTIAAGEVKPLVSGDLPADLTRIRASITPATNSATVDHLTADNVAWTVVEDSGALDVLVVSEGNVFIDRIFGSLPNVNHINATPLQPIPTRPFDLYLFENTVPDALPDGDLLFINPPRSIAGLFTLGVPSEDTANPRVVLNDPRTAYLNVDNLNIRAFTPLENVAWADELVRVDGGGVMFAGEVNGRQVAIINFPLAESDFPLQIGFPIFISNLTAWVQPQTAVIDQTALRVGDSLRVHPLPTADRLRITQPDGTRREFDLNGNLFIYADTTQSGIYTLDVFEGARRLQGASFAVNLFDPNESNITPRETVQVGRAEISETVGERIGQREFWQWFALAALVLLLLEWFAYHRRMAGPRGVFAPIRQR